MKPEQALHTFARRYCIERRSKWNEMRSADYNRESYWIVPRSNVLAAILLDVEALDFDQLPRFDELGDLLVAAGQTARTDFTDGSAPARNERLLFVDAVRGAVAKGPPEQKALPYRRTLSAAEVDALWRKLHETWGFTRDYSYPLKPKAHPSLLAYDLSKIDYVALDRRIEAFFKDNEVRRVLELREFGRENYCLDAIEADLSYNGAGGEGYWTSEKGDWVVYCSHESTITLGGSITAIAPPDPPWDGWR